MENNYLISVTKFLSHYYGISTMNKENGLTHANLKTLFPFVQAVTNVDMKKVYSGDVLLVYDINNNVVAYSNPYLNNDEIVYYESMRNAKKVIDISQIDRMSKDELLTIRRQLRKNNDYAKAKVVTKSIRKVKKNEPINYREKKRNLEEKDYD